MEKVVFTFNNIDYKVGINIDVTDSRIITPLNAGFFIRKEINVE